MTSRTVLREQTDGLKVVEIEQLGEVKILWHAIQFRTRLNITEDPRNPELLTTTFELIRSVSYILFAALHLQGVNYQVKTAQTADFCILLENTSECTL